MPTTFLSAVTDDHLGTVSVHITERGKGRPILLLHGGGGPRTVESFADLLAGTRPARVVTVTHPGFGGTPRPDSIRTVRDLAALYVALLETLDLADVTVVGNSVGGWIAAEMGLLESTRISSVVLVDAVGIDVADHPVADFFALTMDDVAELSYFDPATFRFDPSTLPPEQQALVAANRATLALYATPMTDPTLRGRLARSTHPTLVVWGEADRIVDPDYGRAYADAIPDARFELVRQSGHLPQLETPDALNSLVWDFADAHSTPALPA
jgi:pimeloyl-ACP methyl ester carboxylesterase